MYVSVLALLLLSGSKIYYLGPAYPVLFAAGAAALEGWILRSGRRWLRPATLSMVLAGGLLLVPISLPVLSIDATEAYARAVTFGKFKNVYEITGDLRGQFGWHERLEALARVWSGMDPEERQYAVIWARDYGLAGAIDYFGSIYGLPKAVSGHMTYHLWGLPAKRINTIVTAGLPPERMFRLFDEVGIATDILVKDVNPWDRRFIVSICRRPRMDPHVFWPRARSW